MFPACSATGALHMIELLCDFVERPTGQSLTGIVTDLLSRTLIGGPSAMTISPVIRPASRAPEIAVSQGPVLSHPFCLFLGSLPGVVGRLGSSESRKQNRWTSRPVLAAPGKYG